VADEDVFRHVEVGEDHRLLVDGGDAQRLRLLRVADVHRLAVDQDLTGVGAVDAGHDLDQRGLARAVLADQRVHLARIERQRHILQRLRGVEALGDVLHFKYGCWDRDQALALGYGQAEV
jgi:hypothetical protein